MGRDFCDRGREAGREGREVGDEGAGSGDREPPIHPHSNALERLKLMHTIVLAMSRENLLSG